MATLVYFNETAELPCRFTNSQNLSLNELVIFWQDQNHLVLFDLYQGKKNVYSVDAKYKDRTSFDQDRWTLKLHNVQIQDKGKYSCFIHHKKPEGMLPIIHTDSELSVHANFSLPEITPVCNETELADTVNLTCSSTHGYPEPTSMWFSTGQEKYNAVMKKYQDNVTKLYTVSISASIPLSLGTNSMSIFCVLQQKTAQLWSKPCNIDKMPEPTKPPDQEPSLRIVAICVILAVVFLMGFVIILKKSKKKSGTSDECETIPGEVRKKEELEARVRSHVSEKSDKVQCVINVSKTASEDKSATDT
ncbi:T-lymphocyte activation antigen CD86 [Suncus etruscus]|uniref:T-lymphocyte activation antigen CD86 n=1 Tax=Suncus etruscus TaxID=109475 RepID=UPI0021105891|nr:T-lymphocyte activation antigen CD86 [Suncus etruscus]